MAGLHRAGAGFAIAGLRPVAGGSADLADGRARDSYGLGLRVALAREAVFRIDCG